MEKTSKDTSHPEEGSPREEGRGDIATRWPAGQSGNPKGRPRKPRTASSPPSGPPGSGATPTYLARVMIERPVERSDGVGGTRTRLTEYMTDIVERADAGDLKCRMFLIRYVDRGDRRKLAALRNAEKAKTRALRKLESAAAREISQTPVAPPEIAAQQVKTISPTRPSRVQTLAVAKPSVEASSFRRDPRNGQLLGPDGRALSREAEDRLLYPDWPHISPHLKKEEPVYSGLNTGPKTGPETGPKTGIETGVITGITSPVSRTQEIDSAQNSASEKISQKNPAGESDPGDVPRWRN
jgi:hypothetical protein